MQWDNRRFWIRGRAHFPGLMEVDCRRVNLAVTFRCSTWFLAWSVMPPDRFSHASRSKSSSTSSSTNEDFSGKSLSVNNNSFNDDELRGAGVPLNHDGNLRGAIYDYGHSAVIDERGASGAPGAQSRRGRAGDGGGNALRRRRHQSVHAGIREAKKEGEEEII